MLIVNYLLNIESMLITSPTKTFGLDISDLSLKAVQLKRVKNINYIQAINSIRVQPGLIIEGVIQDQKKIAQLIKKLIEKSPNKFTSSYAVVSLPEPKTFIKVIQISKSAAQKNKIRDLIKEELPRHVPINIEEIQIDWQEVENNNKYRKFLVGAVPTTIVNALVETCKIARINITALEVEAQAIERCIISQKQFKATEVSWVGKIFKHQDKNKTNLEENKCPKIVLDLGATRTSIILIDKGIIQFANSIDNISGEKLTKRIAKEKNLKYEEAEKAKLICGTDPKKCKGETLNIITESINDLAKEIINANTFYQDHFGKDTNNIEIVLCGGGANLSGIDKILKEKLKRKVTIADPTININGAGIKQLGNIHSYTTAIGLALRNYL